MADHVTSGPSSSPPAISRLELLQRESSDTHDQKPDDHGVQRAAAEEKKDDSTIQRAPADKKEEESAVQRSCCCLDEQMQKRPSGTASVLCKSADEKEEPAVQRAGTEDKSDESKVQRSCCGGDEQMQKSSPETTSVRRKSADEKEEPAVQRATAEDKTDESKVQRSCCCVDEQMQKRPSGNASILCKSAGEPDSSEPVRRKAIGGLNAAAAHAISTKGMGAPMRPHVRTSLESRMGVDLSAVRVHEGPAAHVSAAALNARAFTYRSDIWLGRGESQENLHLMAHETTHVVQQGAAVRRASPEKKEPEQRDQQSVVRRSLWGDITGAAGAVWDATGGRVVNAAGEVIAMGADFFWKVVQKVAPPGIVSIIQDIKAKGIVGFLRDKVSGAFRRIFSGLSNSGGFIGAFMKTFTKLMSTAHEVLAALSHGDCQPLFDAVGRLGDHLKEIAGEAWDKVKAFFAPIGDFFSNLWKKFGAPVVDFLGEFASEIWEDIKALGKNIWDWTQPVRDALAAAWKWVKDQLGIGDEPEGQNGLLQWVQKKLGEAWDWITDKLQPVIAPIKSLVSKIQAILPLDAILHLRDTVHEWLHHASDMVKNMKKPKGVAENQEGLRDRILPAIKASIVSLKGKIISAGSWVADQIGGITQTVLGFFSSLRSNSILGGLAGAVQWIEDKVNDLGNWVQGGVRGLFGLLGNGVAKLADFVEPVLNALKKVVSVIANVVKELPSLVMGPVWKIIPACIRDPIKDFIIEHILSAIPIISTFVKLPDIWSKIQKLVMNFLTAVFVNGDLGGAAMMVIRFVLEAVGVNVDLFLDILANAADALDDIIMHPVEFLKNVFSAVKKGFGQFVDNIGTHLMTGLLGWLLGPLEDLGVKPPKDLSLSSILDLVLQILGVTSEKLRKKAEKALGPQAVRILEEAWKWISTLITKGLAGLWEEIKTRLSDLWGMVIGGITQWITKNLVQAGIARLITMSNPVGAVIEAIRTIYKFLTFLVNKINQILMLVNSVVNSISKISKGMIDDAANWIENAMARTIPNILAFFADWLGIDDPAPHVREIVVKIQDKVDAALDWLIDKAIEIGKSLAGLAKGAAGLIFPKEHFEADNEEHTVEAVPMGDDYDIVIRSETRGVESFIKFAQTEAEKNSVSGVDDQTGDLREKYDAWKSIKVAPDDEAGKKEKEAKYEEIPKLIESIWQRVAKSGPVPDSVIHWGPLDSEGRATGVVADPLTKKGDAGGPPEEAIPGWAQEQPGNRSPEGRIRAHLLHHELHGPGKTFNLTPTSDSVNQQMYHQVEKYALKALGIRNGAAGGEVEKTNQLRYETKVTYDNSRPGLKKYFAQHIEMRAVDKEGKQKGNQEIGSLSTDNP